MNKTLTSLMCLFVFSCVTLVSACPRGDMFREYHKNNPNPYVFYEDYLKATQDQSPTEVVAENSVKDSSPAQ